jgi:site-specific DNA-adenine methylase
VRLTIAYPGAKGRLAPSLVEKMPASGRIYLEPFAGRGNVFFSAAPVLQYEQWWLNDISTAPFFTALARIGDRVKIPPRTREEYKRQKRLFFSKRNMRSLLLEPYLTFSGGGYMRGGFGSQHGPTSKGYTQTLRACSKLLTDCRVKVTDLDWKQLQLEMLDNRDFVFFDPPYWGADVRAYSNNFDFETLVETLKNACFKWILTERAQNLYLKTFGKPFYMVPVQLACDGRGTRRSVECAWKNY